MKGHENKTSQIDSKTSQILNSSSPEHLKSPQEKISHPNIGKVSAKNKKKLTVFCRTSENVNLYIYLYLIQLINRFYQKI